jgi:hypothetical protein
MAENRSAKLRYRSRITRSLMVFGLAIVVVETENGLGVVDNVHVIELTIFQSINEPEIGVRFSFRMVKNIKIYCCNSN